MKVLPTLYLQNGRAVPVRGSGGDGLPGSNVPGEGQPAMDLASFLAERSVRFALIDVDAARGTGNNRELMASLLRKLRQTRGRACIQVGGGIRGSDQAQFYLDLGATWLIVGTVLRRSSVAVEQLLARFGNHMTAALDSRGGQVLSPNWGAPLGQRVEDCARLAQEQGFRRLLFTDVPAEETAEPDFETARIAGAAARLPFFMAGSLRTLAHLQQATAIPCMHGALVDATLLAAPGNADLLAALQDA